MTSPAETLRPWLARPGRPDDAFGLAELQGFLFAVANAPRLVMPVESLPLAIGRLHPGETANHEAAAIADAMLDLYSEVSLGSLRAPDLLPPGCTFRDDPVANLEDDAPVARWSRGFRTGHQWLRESWDAAFAGEDESEVARELAYVLIALTFFSSRQVADAVCAQTGGRTLEAVARAMVRAFPAAVAQYASFGRSLQQEALEPLPGEGGPSPAAPKDPCPCGSGRTFERCCGTTH